MDVGNKVRFEGKTVEIVSRYASGKHMQYCFDDGSTALDLHLRDDVEVVVDRPVVSKPVRFKPAVDDADDNEY